MGSIPIASSLRSCGASSGFARKHLGSNKGVSFVTNPIKHHYVAQMYLRGFAPPPSRKQITIVDKRELKPKTTHPSAICFEEHFFSLTDAEEVGADKFMLEKELSHHEGRVAGILKKIRTAKSFDALCKDDIEFLIGWM